MKKAIGYARISDDDQSRWSISGQQDLIRNHCRKEGIDLIAIFTDEGYSASNFDRADWKQLETFVSKNHRDVDYLFVMAYTRFSRNTMEALQMIDQLEQKYDIRILSINEPIHMHPDAPYFHYMRTQIILNGDLELRIIKDRTRFGIHNAQKAGRVVTRPVIGYLRDKDSAGNPIIVVDRVKAPLVLEAYNRFLNGETINSIRNILKEKGLFIRGNSDIQRMLQLPVYMGWVKQISYYDAPETLVKGIHEAIVPEDLWWKVQAIFNNKKKLQRSTLSDDFPLRGVLKCKNDHPMTGAFSRGRNKLYGYYKCNTDTWINLSASKLHKQFDEMLEEMSLEEHQIEYLQGEVLKGITAQIEERSSSSDKIKNQLAGLEKRISNLEEKYIIDAIDVETYKKWKSNYHLERSCLRDQLADLQGPIDEIWRRNEENLGKLGKLQWIYHVATVEEKQGFVREVFDNRLQHDGQSYRTTFLLNIFQPKALILKEKGLLIYEQPPVDLGNFTMSALGRS